MTSKDCITGTDRVSQAYKLLGSPPVKMIINVQGDEPLIDSDDIRKVYMYCSNSLSSNTIYCGACKISEEDFNNPNVVKVVMNQESKLLYASRAGIPTSKDLQFHGAYKQVCIYAIPTSVLPLFWNEKTPLEQIEDIEILRFLEYSHDVYMVQVSESSTSVDTPEDIEKVKIAIKKENQNRFLEKIKDEITSNVGIDFDGVMHKNSKGYHDGTIYDDPIEGTKKALEILSKKYTLIIYTCKANPERPLVNGKTGTELIWDWLEKYDLKQYISEVTNKKPRALFYIDDKGIRFTAWELALQEIELLEKENKEDRSKF